MMALGKILRTTAFKLTLAFLVMFSLGAGLVTARVGYNIGQVLDEQTSQTIDAEINGLSEQYNQGGVRTLVDAVQRRASRPGASLYLVTTFAGERIAGNVAQLPAGVLDRPGATETTYVHAGENVASNRALARIFILPGGFRLLVGRDLAERETLSKLLLRALLTSLFWLTILGTAGGLIVARRVLRRVDAMNASAQTIMEGDLALRLPLAGSNDEIDRLAFNLNAMLDRINLLVRGLNEVSDNIAHDLRTPLTRLRNGAEDALRGVRSPEQYQRALEKVIEESDSLIRIFNALLLIARADSGGDPASMSDFDAAEVLRDVVELYEPLAEEGRVSIHVSAPDSLIAYGNRELIGQAVANLLDNALKYGASTNTNAKSIINVAAKGEGKIVKLEIADNGAGIAEEDRTRILERFVRLDAARSRSGSGLGLSLAAAVARLHKGDLRIEDNAPGLRIVLCLQAGASGSEPKAVAALPSKAAV